MLGRIRWDSRPGISRNQQIQEMPPIAETPPPEESKYVDEQLII